MCDWGVVVLQVFQLHSSLIWQLEAAQLPQWALYVALFIPDTPWCQSPAALRTAAVRELLARHAPVWASQEEARAFLLADCLIPEAWLAEALALWAGYNNDWAGASGPAPAPSPSPPYAHART